MNMKKIVFAATVALLVIAFGVSAFLVGNYMINSKKEQDRYAELATMTGAPETTTEAPATTAGEETASTESTTGPTETTAPTEPKILAEHQPRFEQNSDMVGWIRIDDPEDPENKSWMDYPVVQKPDVKDYYLKRNFDKEQSEWGCIYAWEEADIFTPSDNVTLFGHTMNDGSMFACLHKYDDKKVWEANPWIHFSTLYEYHTYKIFAVFKTTAAQGKGFTYHNVTDMDEAEFDQFVATCKKLSFYDTGITPKYGDKLISLSTCEYTDLYGHGRFVVAAVRWDY